MGSPLSSTMAEIFLQHLEQSKIKYLLEDKKIAFYNRYVDDIFIIYNQTETTPQHILKHFNEQNKNLQFTINEEVNNQITYLDLNLINKHGKIKMEIFRKPTTTDITINNKSCHPREQELAA
jgi:organic radical activating enzyme